MPREVLIDIFNSNSGKTITSEAKNGDKYIVNIVKFDYPEQSEIDQVINEYNAFSEDILQTKMSQIINEDVFQSARVNLSNLVL